MDAGLRTYVWTRIIPGPRGGGGGQCREATSAGDCSQPEGATNGFQGIRVASALQHPSSIRGSSEPVRPTSASLSIPLLSPGGPIRSSLPRWSSLRQCLLFSRAPSPCPRGTSDLIRASEVFTCQLRPRMWPRVPSRCRRRHPAPPHPARCRRWQPWMALPC